MKIFVDVDTEAYEAYVQNGSGSNSSAVSYLCMTFADIEYETAITYPMFIDRVGQKWYVSGNCLSKNDISGFDKDLNDLFSPVVIASIERMYATIYPRILLKENLVDAVEPLHISETMIVAEAVEEMLEQSKEFLTHLKKNNSVVATPEDSVGLLYSFIMKGVKLPFSLEFLGKDAERLVGCVPSLSAYITFDTSVIPEKGLKHTLSPYIDVKRECIELNVHEAEIVGIYSQAQIDTITLDLFDATGTPVYSDIPLTKDMLEAMFKEMSRVYDRIDGYPVSYFAKNVELS